MGFNPTFFSPLTSEPKEHRIAAFDVETSDDMLTFERGCLFVEDHYEIYTNPVEMVETMLSRRYRGFSWCAHNLSYDLAALLPYISNYLKAFFIDGRMFKASYNDKKKHSIGFLDSWGLSSYLSLASLGKAINLPKYPTPPQYTSGDMETPEWKCEKHNRLWCEDCYVSRDAQIVDRYMRMFQQWLLERNSGLGTTAASTAMQFYRRVFLDSDYLIPFPVRNEFARKAYYGGRVEAFKIGQWENINIYDINSLYPYCMATFEYPSPNALVGPTVCTDYSTIQRYEGVSDILIFLPDTYIGFLPYRRDGKVCFPTGTLRGVWTHIEIRNAVKHGAIVLHVYESLYSKELCRPFVNYVQTLYQTRLEYQSNGDDRQQVCKLLLNSLYGKFGQRVDSSLQTIRSFDHYPEGEIPPGAILDVIGNLVFVRENLPSSSQPVYLNTLWASYITAYARLTLFDYLLESGSELYYCDTDSIFTSHKLPTSSHLGGLKQVYEGVSYVGYGLKQYALHRDKVPLEVKAKGIPRRYQTKFLEDGYVSYQHSSGWKEALNMGLNPGQWRTVTKAIRHPEPKREYYSVSSVESSAMDSHPYQLMEVVVE